MKINSRINLESNKRDIRAEKVYVKYTVFRLVICVTFHLGQYKSICNSSSPEFHLLKSDINNLTFCVIFFSSKALTNCTDLKITLTVGKRYSGGSGFGAGRGRIFFILRIFGIDVVDRYKHFNRHAR